MVSVRSTARGGGRGHTSIFEELKIVHCLEHEYICTCLSTYVHEVVVVQVAQVL